MKKICILFIIFIILFSFSILVDAATPNGSIVNVYGNETKINYEIENKKREVATKDALSTLLEKYKTEDVPEDERITEYRWNGYGLRDIEDEITEFNCVINFSVTPYLDENTKWDKSMQMCFAEFDRIDEELILKSISLTPEKYDEFIEAFEEYEKQEETKIEPILEESEEIQIEKITKIIFTVSAIILIMVVLIVALKNKR